MAKKTPVLKCYRKGGQLKAWCPFCATWHLHGAGSGLGPREKSHRVAHCTEPDSPFRQTGYYLQMMTKKELAEIREAD